MKAEVTSFCMRSFVNQKESIDLMYIWSMCLKLAPSNQALHLTLCCSLGLLPQDQRSHESAAESGR